jgi:hypothetical protein
MADEPMARVSKMLGGKISLTRGIYCSAIFYFVCPTSVSTL